MRVVPFTAADRGGNTRVSDETGRDMEATLPPLSPP